MTGIEGFPLSPQQKRIWEGEQVDACRARLALRVEGEVDFAKLERAVAGAAERHEILRTRFVQPAGMKLPLQVIKDTAAIDRAPGGFDLERGPTVRVFKDQDRLVVEAAAIACDARSLRNLVTEIAALYDGGAELEEPLQYADFSAWQGEQLEAKSE